MLKDRFNLGSGPVYECGFEVHPEGVFEIGGLKYRPYWPRGLPKNYKKEEVELMIEKAVHVLKEFYEDSFEHPDVTSDGIKVVRFEGGSMRIRIDENQIVSR
jgi:hypothetical protein